MGLRPIAPERLLLAVYAPDRPSAMRSLRSLGGRKPLQKAAVQSIESQGGNSVRVRPLYKALGR